MDILGVALVCGFIGALCLKWFHFNPIGFGLGVFGLLIPLLVLLVHNDTQTALVILNQVVGVFPLLVMESLGATLALAIFGES